MSDIIEIQLNGETRSFARGLSLKALTEQLAIDLRQVAVEHNRHIITRGQLGEVALAPGDEVEIVEFIGGG